MAGERTEQATPHRREQARKEGDLLHSRELSAAAGTLAGVMTLQLVTRRAVQSWQAGLIACIDLGRSAHWEAQAPDPTLRALRIVLLAMLQPVGVLMVAVVVATLGAALLQAGGFRFHLEAVAWKLDRLNPVTNLQNLFSLRSASRLAKSILPAAVLGVVAVHRLEHQVTIPPLSSARLELLFRDLFVMLAAAAWLLFGWSLVDYFVEWRSREQRLRMSREDLRQEFKETEGNPQIRSRVRGLQRQMRRRKVKADVSKAAVVLTNPTHYAVALGFDFSTMDAPKVLAKGRNLLAEEIKAEARWAGVPIIENPPLARSLYRTVEVGRAIPTQLYVAVAAILAYLYRQRVEEEMREKRLRSSAAPKDHTPSSTPLSVLLPPFEGGAR